MKIPKPEFLVVLLKGIKKARDTWSPFIRQNFPVHLAFFFIFLLGLFFFMAGRQRVVRAATTSEMLWAVSQLCDFEIQDPQNSIAGPGETFDDQPASCTGPFAAGQKMWQVTAFQPTGLVYSEEVRLEVRFFMAGLQDDHLELEVFDGSQWWGLQEYGKKQAPPAALETLGVDLSAYLDSPEKIDRASLRFIGIKQLGQADEITIVLDGARLIVNGSVAPLETPTPPETPTVTPTPSTAPISPTVSMTPTPLDVSRTPEVTPSPTATGSITFTPSPTASPVLTQTTPTATTTPVLVAPAPLVPLPTPTIPSRFVAAARIPGDPHGDLSGVTDSCAGCHTGHAAGGIELRRTWPEESVCYACHAGSGSGTNVEPAFSSYTNSQTGFFKHDVALTNGLHRLDQSSGADYGGGNRHVECEDCHEPHYAARGVTNPPVLQPEMTGISGVEPQWAGPGAPVSFTVLPEADREYQVCFKCHSSFTTLPAYAPDGWNGSAFVANGLPKLTSTNPFQVPDRRDLAQAFNPNQASFHPVVTLGRNQNIAADTFVNGWSQSSMVYCTDCHGNANASTQGNGPHGSPLLHLLKGGANYSTVVQDPSPRVSDQELCFICHNYRAYVTGEVETSKFKEHKKHMNETWGTTCYTCHNTHGSEQRHLINFDTTVVTFRNGFDSQSAWYDASATGRPGCNLICHGDDHNPEEYGP